MAEQRKRVEGITVRSRVSFFARLSPMRLCMDEYSYSILKISSGRFQLCFRSLLIIMLLVLTLCLLR
jgi:hypothetical protein